MDNEEELEKAVKVLVESAFIPLRVAIALTGELLESLSSYKPSTTELASGIIDLRVSLLKAVKTVIEKEIDMLERSKEELTSEGKKEVVKVE